MSQAERDEDRKRMAELLTGMISTLAGWSLDTESARLRAEHRDATVATPYALDPEPYRWSAMSEFCKAALACVDDDPEAARRKGRGGTEDTELWIDRRKKARKPV